MWNNIFDQKSDALGTVGHIVAGLIQYLLASVGASVKAKEVMED